MTDRQIDAVTHTAADTLPQFKGRYISLQLTRQQTERYAHRETSSSSSSSSWRVDSWGSLLRLPTMSTFLCTLPHLSPAGWCSIANLLYPGLSRTPRRSSPVHPQTVTTFHCN